VSPTNVNALVVGIDPGPVPGVVVLCVIDGMLTPHPAVFQSDARSVAWLVEQMFADDPPYEQQILAVERFIVGPRASRSSAPKAGQRTREMIGELLALGAQLGIRVAQRSASEVKPWATDARLRAAGLLETTKGMPHARDAARHALFAAVRDCGLPDPLRPRRVGVGPDSNTRR
jgi:hypothetical protein